MKNKLFKTLFATIFLSAPLMSSCDFTIAGRTFNFGKKETPAAQKQENHSHEFDYDNLTWDWKELAEGGYSATATAKCKGCEEVVTQDATVTSEVVNTSTCVEKGVISYSAKALFNGTEYTDIKSDFLQLGDHKYGDATYTWNNDYSECVAQRECSVCHAKEEENGVIENQIITEATCEHDGISNVKATFSASWAETQYSADSVIPQKEHSYGTDLICSGCKKTLKEINGLDDANDDDAKVAPTLSSYGQSAFDFSSNHTFVNFDFAKNGDFELIYNYKYTQKTSGGDSYYSIYIFNGRDEKGLVIQVNTNRSGEGQDVYLYRNSATEAGAAYKGTTKVADLPTGRSEAGHYYFPRKAELIANSEEDVNVMQIKGTLVDSSTNEYNVTFKTGGNYSKLAQLTTNYDNATEADDLTINVKLGATYFGSLTNPCFRFSKSQSQAVHASDYVEAYTDKQIIYKDFDGNIVAKKTYATDEEVFAPEIKKDGYQFIGWFDQHGNEVDEITTNGKYLVAPRFVEEVKENQIRQTLSDFDLRKDTTEWHDDWAGETISTNGIKDATSETVAIETMFRYRYQSTTSDLYPIFGFTYDGIDETGRVYTRVDLLNSRKDFRGYIYSSKTSLGGAGASGTNYSDTNFQMADNDVYMLSIQIVKNESDFSINVAIQSLGTGASTKITKNFTYNSSSIVDFTNPEYTKMAIIAGTYAPMVKDAF